MAGAISLENSLRVCYNTGMKNRGILYFSATGNSLYIAKKLKEKSGGQIRYIPSYEGDGSEYDEIVLVTPVYSFGMPVPVLDLLARLNKTTGVVAIQNYGGMVGGADRLLYEYALRFGLNIKGVFVLKMPENFTLVMSPPAFYKNAILKSADRRIADVAAAIEAERYRIPKKKRTKEKTYLKNKSNWHIIGERFSATDACVRCGKCVALCPAQNISLRDGEIVFADKCIACLGCFHRCPHHAIVYRNKDNKKRYVNPNVDEAEIGKDIE